MKLWHDEEPHLPPSLRWLGDLILLWTVIVAVVAASVFCLQACGWLRLVSLYLAGKGGVQP